MTKIKVFHHLKRFITIVLVAVLSQVSAQSSNLGNTNNTLQSTYENLIKIVESQSLEFRAYLIFDGFKRAQNITKVSILNKKITGTLIPLEANESSILKFKNQSILDYRVNIDEAHKVVGLQFRSTIEGSLYNFHIKMMPNGNSIMTVYNTDSSLEYRGNVVKI